MYKKQTSKTFWKVAYYPYSVYCGVSASDTMAPPASGDKTDILELSGAAERGVIEGARWRHRARLKA